MPERTHNTDIGFDLRYLKKKAIKLKPNLHTSKKRINIRGGIIDAGYVRNIIAMLQNNSEKAYTIKPNEKIAQAIFLPLVKVAKLVLVRNRDIEIWIHGYSQQLGLNNNHFSAESAFNFYINDKITDCLGGTVNIESARENFYTELFQHTSLPRNYSFTPIIREINQTIERYTQQQFSITYADKGKGRLQTSAVTPKQIQPPNWKKTQVELPTNPSYYYMSRSTINISSTDTSISNATSIFECFPFQRPYGDYFEGFKLRLPMPSGFQSLPLQPDFKTAIIIINPPPASPINKRQQQTLQPPQLPQQPLPQPQQQLQQSNLYSMAYTPIAKLEKFTGKEDNTQVWLNNNDVRAMQAISYFLQDTTNSWYQSLVNKPQDFNTFKIEFLRYFSNNNSINRLANTFTIIKQGENEAVTTYLECFHRNLHQIQAIDPNYFTVAQILNQFIRGLCSSILQYVRPIHSIDLQAAVTNARDFEAAELKANYAQAINLVMNGLSKLDSKLKQFSNSINQKLEGYLADNHAIYQLPQQYNNSRNANCFQNQSHLLLSTNQQWQQETRVCHYCGKQGHLQINCQLLTYDAVDTLSTTSILNAELSTDNTSNLSATATTYLLATVSGNISAPTNLNTNPKAKIDPTKLEIINSSLPTDSQYAQNPNSQNYLSLLIIPEDATLNKLEPNQPAKSTHNIPPATITEDKFLATIFIFELEKTTTVLLFSRAALEEKPIMAMYTDVKVDGQSIKLILDSRSVGSIITRQLMDQLSPDRVTKTPIGKIDNFSIEINGITIPIKVFVMDVTQYQALVGNDWLTKTNAILNWTTQELQLSQNSQHMRVPATCGYFKPSRKGKKTNIGDISSLTDNLTWTDNDKNELTPNWEWKEENNKEKRKEKEEKTTTTNTTSSNSYTYTILLQSTYH
ncbi:hypothetical protein G9A89_007925 [Geosiphon pyriformis]|nr:hypothetical protein G9A89_007925 [Geosiphon pyriformis]